MYVDYDYYVQLFAGTLIPAEAFPSLEKEAECYLNYVTCGRYAAIPAPVSAFTIKNALCTACEALYSFDQEYKDIPVGISSESTDGHSVTFAKTDPSERAQQRDDLMYKAFAQMLVGTSLLYQGA